LKPEDPRNIPELAPEPRDPLSEEWVVAGDDDIWLEVASDFDKANPV
jgi:hypothetical protein